MTETALYRHFNASGALLYVGISLSAVRRLSQHATKPWFQEIASMTVEKFPSRIDACAAEKEAILSEKPIHNKTPGRRSSPPIEEKGRPLARYLNEAGISQSEFARRAGLSAGTMSDILSGRRAIGKASAIKIISASGGALTFDDLMAEKPE